MSVRHEHDPTFPLAACLIALAARGLRTLLSSGRRGQLDAVFGPRNGQGQPVGKGSATGRLERFPSGGLLPAWKSSQLRDRKVTAERATFGATSVADIVGCASDAAKRMPAECDEVTVGGSDGFATLDDSPKESVVKVLEAAPARRFGDQGRPYLLKSTSSCVMCR